ncbi:hypothetical protein [Streptomyces genisteinicus]|uniref:Secreted protein n=1 Tax=Streptomyces genisteinicus TaxID=2768068 RepID=A0A7H0HWY0_9ACTN|nr:hypothetical protein [Streptomyces genisteinicus]QNP65046.1 hypothetical protein IAG43_20410 [Streptomyces genisteinicus]
MSIRRVLKARRGAAAVVTAAGLVLALAGCGGDEGKQDDQDKSSSSSKPAEKEKEGSAGSSAQPDPEQVIATVKGRDGMVLMINSVERDSGGFVTVNGQVENTGSAAYYATTEWRGTEEELRGGGQSVGGATLVDKVGKKRYYVLRDTDGRCLCTSGFTQVDAGKKLPIFMQFPAPPESTTQVDFQLPSFPNTTLEITG